MFLKKFMLFINAFFFSATAFAHTGSQSSILKNETGRPEYIGGENVGWSLDENFHTDGINLFYKFNSGDTYLTAAGKTLVKNGASRWASYGSVSERDHYYTEAKFYNTKGDVLFTY